jgi:hypothetical protein
MKKSWSTMLTARVVLTIDPGPAEATTTPRPPRAHELNALGRCPPKSIDSAACFRYSLATGPNFMT